MIELKDKHPEIRRVTIFEDKCSETPRRMFRDEIMPAFLTYHERSRANELLAAAATLLGTAGVSGTKATTAAARVLDKEYRAYRGTRRFAELVARRLRQAEGEDILEQDDEAWPLTRIADTYELVTSIIEHQDTKRAAAFVAETAQQILAQETVKLEDRKPVPPILDRDRVDPALATAVLFLAAEQYADAIEAAQKIQFPEEPDNRVSTLLAEDIRDLAAGRLYSILDRAGRRPEHFMPRGALESRSVTAPFEALLVGVEAFAADAGSRQGGSRRLFRSATTSRQATSEPP